MKLIEYYLVELLCYIVDFCSDFRRRVINGEALHSLRYAKKIEANSRKQKP